MSTLQPGGARQKFLTLALILTLCWLSACQAAAGGGEGDQPTEIVALPGPSPSLSPTVTAPNAPAITNFDDCLAAGFPIMESYPRQCRAADGRIYVEDIGNELEKIDLIRLDSPRPNAQIQSPLLISGEARGFWFFEADFPIRLLDAAGNEIAFAIAQAQADWMTEEFVPFEATLTFTASSGTRATLVLEKDNPSGLPENADALIVPVVIN